MSYSPVDQGMPPDPGHDWDPRPQDHRLSGNIQRISSTEVPRRRDGEGTFRMNMPTNSQGWDSRLPEPAVSRADAVSKWSYLSQDSCGMVPHTESFQESSRQTVKSFEIDARVPSPSYPLEHVYNHPEGVPPIAPIETSQMESSHGDGQQWRHSDDLFGIMPHVSSTAAPYSPLVERYPQSCLSPPTNKICPVIVEPIARRPQTQREPFQCDRKQSDSRYMHGGGDSGNIERSPSSLDMNAEISSFGPSINDDDVSLNQPDDRLDFCDPDLSVVPASTT